MPWNVAVKAIESTLCGMLISLPILPIGYASTNLLIGLRKTDAMIGSIGATRVLSFKGAYLVSPQSHPLRVSFLPREKGSTIAVRGAQDGPHGHPPLIDISPPFITTTRGGLSTEIAASNGVFDRTIQRNRRGAVPSSSAYWTSSRTKSWSSSCRMLDR